MAESVEMKKEEEEEEEGLYRVYLDWEAYAWWISQRGQMLSVTYIMYVLVSNQ